MSAKIDLNALQSEGRNQNSLNIDVLSTEELCRIINDEDKKVPSAVQKCLPTIAGAIDALTSVVRAGGKVVYVGAGTSGRLGVLDASELPPTYSAKSEQFVALIAGGDRALRHAQEGAEDNAEQAIQDMKDVNLQKGDALIGIAASGRTPYVLGCLKYAKAIGCATVGVACSSPSTMATSGVVDYMIEAVTGAEVVTGSTRMKAGTATKMVLNMLSTGVQIRLGKTYGNMMVDVRATNLKLQQRARNIIRELCDPAQSMIDEDLDVVLQEAGGSVKLAIVMLNIGISADSARKRLEEADGVLAKALRDSTTSSRCLTNGNVNQKYVLCIDGGGSKCAAYVLASNGEVGSAIGPATNVTTSVAADAVATIQEVAQKAVDGCPSLRGQQLKDLFFSKAWIGLAGFDRPQVAAVLDPMLRKLFREDSGTRLKITNDLELLAAAAGKDGNQDVCVLVAGTGSIAMAFRECAGAYSKIGRVGGWGPLLGDDGSGFDIGRKTIRHVLELSEAAGPSTGMDDPLVSAVLNHVGLTSGPNTAQEVLSSMLVSAEGSKTDARQKIADVARITIEQGTASTTAAQIVAESMSSMVRLIQRVVTSTAITHAKSKLVMTGGLLQASSYRSDLQQAVLAAGFDFVSTDVVLQPGLFGARALLAEVCEGKKSG